MPHGPCTFSHIPSTCFHLAKLTLQRKGLCMKPCSPSEVIRADSPCPWYLTVLGNGVLSSLKGEEMSMSLRGLDHSLIIFPQLFWRVDQGGCVNGDSTLLAGDAGRQFACAGPSSCLPPAIANRQCEPCTPSCPSPCQHAELPACLNHASFCQLPKVFPLPHHCTKAG